MNKHFYIWDILLICRCNDNITRLKINFLNILFFFTLPYFTNVTGSEDYWDCKDTISCPCKARVIYLWQDSLTNPIYLKAKELKSKKSFSIFIIEKTFLVGSGVLICLFFLFLFRLFNFFLFTIFFRFSFSVCLTLSVPRKCKYLHPCAKQVILECIAFLIC